MAHVNLGNRSLTVAASTHHFRAVLPNWIRRRIIAFLSFFLAASFPPQLLTAGTTATDLAEVASLIQQARLDAAEARLKKMEVENPDNGAIYRLLGIVYERRAQFAPAEKALARAVALSVNKDPQLLFLLCQTEFALHKRKEALQLANQISGLAESNPVAHYSLGRLLAVNSEFDEALAELRKAHSLAADNPAITTELIIAYLCAKREQPALRLMTSFFQNAGYDDLIQAGARFGDAGQFAAAERAFTLATQAKPGDYDAGFNLAFAYFRHGDLDKALTSLNAIDPRAAQPEWDYHYLLGKIQAALHHNRIAETEMTTALKLKPGDEGLCSDAGLLFFRLDDFWEALKVYQSCAAHLPGSTAIETGLGLTYFRLGKYNDAIATFRTVLAVRPEADAAREALGFLLYAEGDLNEAQATLEHRTEAQDADYYIYYLNALVLMRLHAGGDHSHALHLLDETLRKSPRFAPAYFEEARIWEDRNKPEEALVALRRATTTDPQYAQPYYLIAQVDYKLGKKDEAREAQLKFGILNREREEKLQEQQVEDQLLQSLR
jgi:tetratricopeptide (TPR) repeat protein